MKNFDFFLLVFEGEAFSCRPPSSLSDSIISTIGCSRISTICYLKSLVIRLVVLWGTSTVFLTIFLPLGSCTMVSTLFTPFLSFLFNRFVSLCTGSFSFNSPVSFYTGYFSTDSLIFLFADPFFIVPCDFICGLWYEIPSPSLMSSLQTTTSRFECSTYETLGLPRLCFEPRTIVTWGDSLKWSLIRNAYQLSFCWCNFVSIRIFTNPWWYRLLSKFLGLCWILEAIFLRSLSKK